MAKSRQVDGCAISGRPSWTKHAVTPLRSDHSTNFSYDMCFHQSKNWGHLVSVYAGIQGVRQPLSCQAVGVQPIRPNFFTSIKMLFTIWGRQTIYPKYFCHDHVSTVISLTLWRVHIFGRLLWNQISQLVLNKKILINAASQISFFFQQI